MEHAIIKVVSDGSPMNTYVTVDGKPVDAVSVSVEFTKDDLARATFVVYIDKASIDIPLERSAADGVFRVVAGEP